jgi:chemotaxis protein MotB
MAKPNTPIIIKKVKKAAHAHHGGAWKIAYADFVTAMMAFFLLMWLINMTTQEQKIGLAEYFAKEAVSLSPSGAGSVLSGNSLNNSRNLGQRDPTKPSDAMISLGREHGGQARAGNSDDKQPVAVTKAYHSAAASIRQALKAMPELTPYANNLQIKVTDEGLDIDLTEQNGRRMFAKGSKVPLGPTQTMLTAMAPILEKLNSKVTISGHTAAGERYADLSYGPWELTADRANMVRAILTAGGLSQDHISSVTGRASTEPYFVDDPFMSVNERVTVSVAFPPPPIPAEWRP